MIQQDTLIQLLTKIAIASQGKPHLRINSFALIESLTDINQINLGHGVSSEKKGYAWSRFGASVNNDKKIYPSLFLMKRSLSKKGKDKCHNYTIAVAVPEKCKSCGDSFTSIDAAIRAETLLCEVHDALREFRQYKVRENEGDEYSFIIAHPDELKCLELDENRGECGLVKDWIDEEMDITTDQYGINGVQMAAGLISSCGCKESDTSSNFDFCKVEKEGKKIAIVKCDSCF